MKYTNMHVSQLDSRSAGRAVDLVVVVGGGGYKRSMFIPYKYLQILLNLITLLEYYVKFCFVSATFGFRAHRS